MAWLWSKSSSQQPLFKEDVMKRVIIISLVAFSLIFTLGCGSKHYLIKTKDGKEYVSSAKPEFDKKTQSYEFRDLDGKKWILNREEIVNMEMTKH
jgi:hypothetical protein